MGNFPAQAQNNSVLPPQEGNGGGSGIWEAFVEELNEKRTEIATMLPATVTIDPFMTALITAIKKDSKLLKVDRKSLFRAALAAAADGLLPDGADGVILPQNDNGAYIARWNPMAEGIRKRAWQIDGIIIDTQVVHDNDHVWKPVFGSHPRIDHEPNYDVADRGPMKAVYAIFKQGNNVLHHEVMHVSEVEKIRDMSKQKNGLMWTKFFGEGARKTVLHRGFKTVPCSSALNTVVNRWNDNFDLNSMGSKPVYTPEPAHTSSNTITLRPVMPPVSQESASSVMPPISQQAASLSPSGTPINDGAVPQAEVKSLFKEAKERLHSETSDRPAKQQTAAMPPVSRSAQQPGATTKAHPKTQAAMPPVQSKSAEPATQDGRLLLKRLDDALSEARSTGSLDGIWRANEPSFEGQSEQFMNHARAAYGRHLERLTRKAA